MQDEKQALHDCVREALAQTQHAAVADRAAAANGQEYDIDAAVQAQIQQRRNQQVGCHVPCAVCTIAWPTLPCLT